MMNECYNNDDDSALPPPYPHSTEYNNHQVNPEIFTCENSLREEKYRNIVDKHEISLEYAQRLQLLQGYKIIFIFDDSGSMNSPLMDSPLNNKDSLLQTSRWEELQYFAKISVEIATLFDPEGCSIYFLNRKPSPVHNISHESQVSPLFKVKPKGFTPLGRVLETVLDDTANLVNEKKILLIIATDGEPTDDKGNEAIKEFRKVLEKRGPRIFCTIVACTDDDASVGYLNEWDRQIRNLDVVDDFRSERIEIKKKEGTAFRFSFGDYVVKSLIGSIDPLLDRMDEKNCCCSIL